MHLLMVLAQRPMRPELSFSDYALGFVVTVFGAACAALLALRLWEWPGEEGSSALGCWIFLAVFIGVGIMLGNVFLWPSPR